VADLACVPATSIDTSTPTTGNSMFLITYTATNSRGIAGEPRHRVVVVRARCTVRERWCASLQTCSVNGLCLAPGKRPSMSSCFACVIRSRQAEFDIELCLAPLQ
jgi:hypothetical protein